MKPRLNRAKIAATTEAGRESDPVVAVVERIPKVNGMIIDVPMAKKVGPTGARKLRVRFAEDRREYVLDLTGLIARSRHFAPLMEDADTFAKIDIIDDGLSVAWPVETKWGNLDLSGSTLR